MTSEKKAVIAAGLGATAPNLFKIAIICTGGPVAIPPVGYMVTYTLGLIVMAGIGMGICYAFKETNMRKAVFIGLGLPSLLQVSMANFSQVHAEKPAEVAPAADDVHASLPLGFVGVAYADDTTAASAGKVRALNIKSDGNKKPDGVIFYSADRKIVQSLAAKKSGDVSTVDVPATATSFAINYQNVVSKPMTLEATHGDEQNVAVSVGEKNWSGLFQAVGYNSAAPYDVDVRNVKN